MTTPSMPTAGVPFVLTYRPLVNGSPFDPVDEGGTMGTLRLYTDAARTALAATVNASTRVEPGVYTFTVPALPAGTYYATVTYTPTATASLVTDANDVVYVYPLGGSFSPATLVSLVEVKRHLNFDDPTAVSPDDDELTLMVQAVGEVAEQYLGALVPRVVTETLDSADLLTVRHAPVLSVSSVTYGPSTTLGSSEYEVDLDAGLIRPIVRYHGPYTITYTAGRDPIPAAIKLGALITLAHSWETQRGAGGLPLNSPDDTAFVPRGSTFAVPARALAFWQPYRRLGLA